MEQNKICIVTNRSTGIVTYRVPEMNVARTFSPREVKRVPYVELEAVSMQPGGRELLHNYLFVQDADVVEALIQETPDTLPEYFLSEDRLRTWMEESDLDEFHDALNLAPDGIKDLIRKFAVELPLNSYDKRQEILDILGFDVNAAIELSKEDREARANAPKIERTAKKKPKYTLN